MNQLLNCASCLQRLSDFIMAEVSSFATRPCLLTLGAWLTIMDPQPWLIVRGSVIVDDDDDDDVVVVVLLVVVLLVVVVAAAGAGGAHVSLYDGGCTNLCPCHSIHVHHNVSSLSLVKP